MVKLGVQASTIKDSFKNDGPYETMRKLAEIGYKSIEISQVETSEENVQEIVRACKDFDMEVASWTAALEPQIKGGESLTTHFDKIVKDMKTVGTDLIRIGMLPMDKMASLEKIIEFCEEANEVAEKLAKEGIKLYYHNHHIEFVKYDGKFLLDIIREKAPLLGFEIDVHWAQRGGVNPVQLIEDYSGKVVLVHLKDYRVKPMKQEAIDALFRGELEQFLHDFTNNIEFAELGEGSLPMNEIIKAAEKAHCRYLLVEQDDCYGRDPFDSLRISYDWLVDNGYGDWF